MNYKDKIKSLEKRLQEKQAEKRQVVADYKARKIPAREAAKLLGELNKTINDTEKEIRRASK